MARKIQNKYGPKSRLPKLPISEIASTTDTKEIFIGSEEGNIQIAKKDDVETVSKALGGKADQSTVTELTAHLADIAINVKDKPFNAQGNGVTVDNIPFQQAIDYVHSLGGGTVKIPKGTYGIDPLASLFLKDGVTLEMDKKTILRVIPNNLNAYHAIKIANVSDVSIKGGRIKGDRTQHTGTAGEHGMGISILHANNVVIEQMKISDCWGDGIYIGGNNFGYSGDTPPTNIIIDKVTINNCRRQGVSITMCDGVNIISPRITNINGIDPQYGIDIETNDSKNPCKNVFVSNAYFKGSNGGGLVVGNNAENVKVTNSIFDGNNLNITKCKGATISSCTFMDTDVFVRSSEGVTISGGNIFRNSSVQITTNADITKDTLIDANIFENLDGSTTRKAVSLTGLDNGCYELSITNNIFRDFISETIYLYNYVNGGKIANNSIKVSQLTRWAMLIRSYDLKVNDNSLIAHLTNQGSIDNLINLTGIRGTFESNTISLKNLTIAEAIITAGTKAGETIGSNIKNNEFFTSQSIPAVKFNSTSETKYKVMNNDFKYTNNAILNPTGHFVYGNILSTTLSQ